MPSALVPGCRWTRSRSLGARKLRAPFTPTGVKPGFAPMIRAARAPSPSGRPTPSGSVERNHRFGGAHGALPSHRSRRPLTRRVTLPPRPHRGAAWYYAPSQAAHPRRSRRARRGGIRQRCHRPLRRRPHGRNRTSAPTRRWPRVHRGHHRQPAAQRGRRDFSHPRGDAETRHDQDPPPGRCGGSAIVAQRRLIARLRDGAPFERDGRDYLIVERAAAACYRSARHRTVESRG